MKKADVKGVTEDSVCTLFQRGVSETSKQRPSQNQLSPEGVKTAVPEAGEGL